MDINPYQLAMLAATLDQECAADNPELAIEQAYGLLIIAREKRIERQKQYLANCKTRGSLPVLSPANAGL